jgi:hypothetical protein
LPQALQAAKPFMSEKDTEAGGLWDLILATQLEASDFGIACLTPSNVQSRWLNFEAGALSKAMTRARVVPLLFQLEKTDVGLPLSRFQMKLATCDGILDIVKAINASAESDRKVEEGALIGTFESMWPKLEAKPNGIPPVLEARERSDRELLEEILALARENSDRSNPLAILSRRNPGWFDIAQVLKSDEMLTRLLRIAGSGGSIKIEEQLIIAYGVRFRYWVNELDADEIQLLKRT